MADADVDRLAGRIDASRLGDDDELDLGEGGGEVGQARERRRQCRAREALSDAVFKDLGLSRADVALETRKWPWRP